jgi:hypothetical protein
LVLKEKKGLKEIKETKVMRGRLDLRDFKEIKENKGLKDS